MISFGDFLTTWTDLAADHTAGTAATSVLPLCLDSAWGTADISSVTVNVKVLKVALHYPLQLRKLLTKTRQLHGICLDISKVTNRRWSAQYAFSQCQPR